MEAENFDKSRSLAKILLAKKLQPDGRRVGRGKDGGLCNLGRRLNRRDRPDRKQSEVKKLHFLLFISHHSRMMPLVRGRKEKAWVTR